MRGVQNLRVGFVGAGRRAVHHVRAFHEIDGVELVAVSDPVELARQSVMEEFGIDHGYADTEMMLDQHDLEAIVVAAPPHLNVVAAKPSVERGIDTLVEKPPGITTEEVSELADLAAKSGARVMVGLDRRFNPWITAGVRAVRGRGPIRQLVGEFHKDPAEFFGRGLSEDMLDALVFESPIHTFDILRHIADSEVATVSAHAARRRIQYRDVHAAMIMFENGIVAQFTANYTTGGRLERYEIHGDGISAYLEGVSEGWLLVDGERQELKPDSEARSWELQNRHFADCLRSGADFSPGCDISDAVKTIALGEQLLSHTE